MNTNESVSFLGVDLVFNDFENVFKSYKNTYSSIIILTDKHVEQCCLNKFKSLCGVQDYQLISINAGEESKSLESVDFIINQLLDIKADRKSLLINLGGGMITDLGGFCASIYKRGIDFINVPTSLLGMTDASIGGKTGIDHTNIKNVIGTFYLPKAVVINTAFLETLPHSEFINGLAEVFKHAIIEDADLWEALIFYNFNKDLLPDELLIKSIKVKTHIVDKDYKELSERKKLNFGHTIGHALEALFSQKGMKTEHGQAVAAGIWMESWINSKAGDLSQEDFEAISFQIEKYYSKLDFSDEDFNVLIEFILNDKKIINQDIQIAKIESIGYSLPQLNIDIEIVKKAFEAYIKNLNHLKTF